MKRLLKIGAGISAAASSFYWLALPALAESVNLCPSTGFGVKVPGCGSTPPTVQQIVSFGINVLLFAAFIIALVFLIIGGIRWILSGGDKEATQKAKSTVTSALIGLVVVLAAWILINLILQVLTNQNLGNLNVPTVLQ